MRAPNAETTDCMVAYERTYNYPGKHAMEE